MKIIVLPKERMRALVEEAGVKPDDFYVTVKSPVETEYAVEADAGNVLKLAFDDAEVEVDGEELTLFDEDMAFQVCEFFAKMQEERKPDSILYVNCGAGISRSGAIGEAANILFNRILEDCTGDYYEFYFTNHTIQPNLLVKSTLMRAIDEMANA